jgi:hypothetical protein
MKQKIQRIKNYFKQKNNNKGAADILMLLYSIPIIIIIMYLSIDMYGYMSTKQKIQLAVNETLEVVKAENGFTNETKLIFDEFASKLGLNPSKIQVTGTAALVQRGTPVEVLATTIYEARGLKPLGKTLVFNIKVNANGLVSTQIRGL